MNNNHKTLTAKCSGKRTKSKICVYYGPTPKTILSDFSVDISTGGLYLETEFPLAVDERLRLVFSLPEQEQEKAIHCTARVAWVNYEKNKCKPELPAGIGVQFLDLSLTDLRSISKFTQKH